jgi:N-methylhydantoinase A
MPSISLVEIGAGGGSIASIDPGGALTIGPESAGAAPGPACYGKGGIRPTITDANLVLGRLNPDYFLGGALTVYPDLAREVITRDIARPLGLGLEAAAQAIIDIANAKMIAALQLISIKRGIDPRDYVLVPSGGAGPVHALAIAQVLGTRNVVIPPTPGLNSALGLLATDVKHEIVRSVFKPTLGIGTEAFGAILADMESQGRRLLADEEIPADRIKIIREAEVCYFGQNYPLRIPIDGSGDDPPARTDAAFRAQHRHHYGFASETEKTVILNLRLTAVGLVDRPRMKHLAQGGEDASQALKQVRRVIFDTATECQIYDRARLLSGNVITGPAIIEQMDTTIVIPADATVRVDVTGSLVATLTQRG